MSSDSKQPLVGILMGSKSDWETMQAAAKILDEFGVPHEAKVASAHRSPALVTEFVTTAEKRGLEVIIAAAGLAAHLPGVVAAQTLLPVLGVPMHSNALGGLDALLAIAQEAKDDPELVKKAPHSTPVRRLDEARAARKPILRWESDPTRERL